jgi:hypothetical protein
MTHPENALAANEKGTLRNVLTVSSPRPQSAVIGRHP